MKFRANALRDVGLMGPPEYKYPRDLASAAADYLEWLDAHPLLEEVISFYEGCACRSWKSKKRAPTKQGLSVHLRMPVSRLSLYKARGDQWEMVVSFIEALFYADKFEGAAAGLYSASMIQRDLGLADKTQSEVTATVDTKEDVNEDHMAIHVHPDDPDPLNVPRPLFSKAQLEAGIPFYAPDVSAAVG